MRSAIALCVVFLFCVTVPSIAVQEDPAAAPSSGGDPPAKDATEAPEQILLHVLQSTPARDVGQSLTQLFRDKSDLQIVTDAANNSVIVRGPPDLVGAVTETLKRLDQPPKLATFTLFQVEVIGEGENTREKLVGPLGDVKNTLNELQSKKVILVTDEIQISTLDGQSTKIQIGRQVPRVTSTTMSSRGRVSSHDYVNVGTLISLTSRVNDTHVILELDFEKSDLRQTPATNDDPPPPPEIVTTTLRTTVAVPDGHAVIVAGAETRSENGTESDTFLVLGAQVSVVGRQPASAKTAANATRKRRPASPTSQTPEKRPPDSTFVQYSRYSRGVMAKYDKNGDGQLDKEESSGMSIEHGSADEDGDGQITLDELTRRLMTGVGSSAPRRRPTTTDDSRYVKYAKTLIERYDADNDDMLDDQERAKSSMLKEMEDFDTDGDGKVDAQELTDWMLKSRSR